MTLTQPRRTTGVSPAPASRRRSLVALWAVVGGTLLAVVWSYRLVDDTIGDNVANGILGYDAEETAISGALTGALFALVTGLAGTFTACNIAVFGVLPEMTGRDQGRLRAALKPMGWLAIGMLAVSAAYGAAAVLIGPSLPQLSADTVGSGIPVRLVQASVTFGVIGLVFVYLGLVSLGYLRDPFAARPRTRMIVVGALVGGFLVGRPYPLFAKLLGYAIEQGNPLYGSLTFVLQSVGNILVMGLLAAALLVVVTRTRFGRWMARPQNAALAAGSALVLFGTFLVVYWDLRLPAMFGYGWFPSMPWNV
ncbi:hypothetical protein [Geodermatophilus maliterrae]|uniref:Cytochrome C biogenesis protein transmembrane region n=1 Tax=Geodermatophilus maliterrae TaxID=3162531 RepID=A0ABV3XHH7_9ACTN